MFGRSASLLAAFLLPGAVGLARAQENAPVEVDAEIVLAVDASRSMDLTEFAVQRDGYLQALRHPELIRAITSGPLGRVAFAYTIGAGTRPGEWAMSAYSWASDSLAVAAFTVH